MPECGGLRTSANREQLFMRLQRSLSDGSKIAICWIIYGGGYVYLDIQCMRCNAGDRYIPRLEVLRKDSSYMLVQHGMALGDGYQNLAEAWRVTRLSLPMLYWKMSN
jgi:hypothetical protein